MRRKVQDRFIGRGTGGDVKRSDLPYLYSSYYNQEDTQVYTAPLFEERMGMRLYYSREVNRTRP